MRTLGLVASAGAGVETRLRVELAEPAVRRAWRLAVVLTPTAARWLDSAGELDRLRGLTELPVRSSGRLPGEPKPYPMPDAFLFVPATVNSLAKLAMGIADNQALTSLGEAVGAPGVPMVVRPQGDPNQRRHPAFAGHLAALRAAGVRIADGPAEAPWEPLLDLLDPA
jgi:hypothetical protein